MKPYIITHMMSTVDGRIDCPMVGCLNTDEYYVALDKLGKCSKLSGRVTTVLESDAVEKATEGSEGRPIGHEAFHVAEKADEYTIAVDTYGKIQWKKNEADGHPLLSIMSEDVSEEYLEALTDQGISWITAGKGCIDLRRAVEILHEQFGVERLAVVGGGHICGGFAKAGLIDEVSVMLAPGIDGRDGQTDMFDGISKPDFKPYKLKLDSVERCNADILWIRYKMMK